MNYLKIILHSLLASIIIGVTTALLYLPLSIEALTQNIIPNMVPMFLISFMAGWIVDFGYSLREKRKLKGGNEVEWTEKKQLVI